MNKVKFLLCSLALVALAACTADPTTEGSGVNGEADIAAKKFVNSSVSAIDGRLIIMVDEATAETLASAGDNALKSVAALDAVDSGASTAETVSAAAATDESVASVFECAHDRKSFGNFIFLSH